MATWLTMLIHLPLALILGGGIVMGSCVRPVLLASQGAQSALMPGLAAVIDRLRVRAWERFNRLSLLAALCLVPLLVVYAVSNGRALAYLPVALAILLLVALLRKLVVDRRLQQRLRTAGAQAITLVSSEETLIGRSERRELEILTIAILILALILIIWPLV
jgi:hypothetical protein